MGWGKIERSWDRDTLCRADLHVKGLNIGPAGEADSESPKVRLMWDVVSKAPPHTEALHVVGNGGYFFVSETPPPLPPHRPMAPILQAIKGCSILNDTASDGGDFTVGGDSQHSVLDVNKNRCPSSRWYPRIHPSALLLLESIPHMHPCP